MPAMTSYTFISLLSFMMAALLAVSVLPFIVRDGLISIFYPPIFLVLFFIIFFLVPTAVVLLNPEDIVYRYQYGGYQAGSWLITLIFSFLFVILTSVVAARLTPFQVFKDHAVRSATAIGRAAGPRLDLAYMIVFVAIPLASFAYMLVKFGGGSYQDYMVNRIVARSGLGFVIMPSTWLTISLTVAILVGLTGQDRRKYLLFSIPALVLFIWVQLYLGSKSRGLIVVVYALLSWAFLRAGQAKSSVKFLLLAPVIATAVMGAGLLFGDLREATTRGTSLENVETRVSPSALLSKVNAFGAIENSLWLVENMSSEDYIMGRSFLAVAVGIVPRALWPDKPVGGGPELRNLIHPGSYDLNTGFQLSSYSTGIIAEAYMNFGFLGFAIVAPILGLLISVLASHVRYVTNMTALVIYIIILYRATYVLTGEVFNTFAGIFMTLLPIFLVKGLRAIIAPRHPLPPGPAASLPHSAR